MDKQKNNRRYLKRNPLFNLLLFLIDALLFLLLKKNQIKHIEKPISRILLSNGAHLGDVIISTSILPILKARFPDAKIGFLVGSWSRMIVTEHPMVDFVHTVDHWRLNRGKENFISKFWHYLKTRKIALKEIKEKSYDISIDLYTCFPNSIPLIWQCQIPIRIGFVSSGFGPLLTCGIKFPDEIKHESLYQADLLRQLHIPNTYFDLQRYTLRAPILEDTHEVKGIFNLPLSAAIPNYCVIHMGTGSPPRELSFEFWRNMAGLLLKKGFFLLFTGVGSRENKKIEQVIANLPNCINACNKLSWNGYLAAVHHAKFLFGVESMAGHVAAGLNTKCVVAYAGITDAERWKPLGDSCKVITNRVPCSPCYKKNGCSHMQCICGITPESAYDAGIRLINDQVPSINECK